MIPLVVGLSLLLIVVLAVVFAAMKQIDDEGRKWLSARPRAAETNVRIKPKNDSEGGALSLEDS